MPRHWIQALPREPKAQGRDGREITFSTDIVIANSILPIAVDCEHETFYWGGPAVGWAHELENRDGEVWAGIDLKEEHEGLLAKDEYKYCSPVVSFGADGTAIEIFQIGLTNRANFRMRPVQAFSVQHHAAEIGRMRSTIAELQQQVAAYKTREIEAEVDSYCRGDSPKITPSQRDSMLRVATHSIETFRSLMAATPAMTELTREVVAPSATPPSPQVNEIAQRLGVKLRPEYLQK